MSQKPQRADARLARRSANAGLRPDRPIEATTREVEVWESAGRGCVVRNIRMSLPRVRFLERRDPA